MFAFACIDFFFFPLLYSVFGVICLSRFFSLFLSFYNIIIIILLRIENITHRPQMWPSVRSIAPDPWIYVWTHKKVARTMFWLGLIRFASVLYVSFSLSLSLSILYSMCFVPFCMCVGLSVLIDYYIILQCIAEFRPMWPLALSLSLSCFFCFGFWFSVLVYSSFKLQLQVLYLFLFKLNNNNNRATMRDLICERKRKREFQPISFCI